MCNARVIWAVISGAVKHQKCSQQEIPDAGPERLAGLDVFIWRTWIFWVQAWQILRMSALGTRTQPCAKPQASAPAPRHTADYMHIHAHRYARACAP